jgi:cholesterol oxidase
VYSQAVNGAPEENAFEHEREPFDAVVVGSGFGGAVAAWKLKLECPEARVLVLERGMPYPPGSFPRAPREMRTNFWDPDAWLYGLFEVWSFAHSRAIVASGLGGGSLIYANVMLKKPQDTFKVPDGRGGVKDWPIDYADLRDRYKEVKRVQKPERLPSEYLQPTRLSSRAVPKTQQFLDAAAAAGLEQPKRAKLAITFASEGRNELGAPLQGENLHGRRRHTCTLVGECDIGCNEGAKNTLDYTFLSEFKDAHGEIRTCCEVLDVAREKGAFRIRYCQHMAARERVEQRAAAESKQDVDRRLLDTSQAPLRSLTARVVILSAGTLGSTRLLLKSRLRLPRLSPRLGHGFSSNGDLITFARGCTDRETGRLRDLAPSRGPVITAYARRRVRGQDLWMQDAGGPRGSEWGWQLGEGARDLLSAGATMLPWRRPRGRVSGVLAGLVGSTASSSAMLPMLTMGRDVPGGSMELDGDSLTLDWNPADSEAHFDAAEETAAMVAEELGGRLGPWLLRKRTRGTTVHPLGGCAMGDRWADGVVDASGQVFGCPGLFVADGSVMPGPIGPNPSFTIAAVAHLVGEAAASRLKAPGAVGAEAS